MGDEGKRRVGYFAAEQVEEGMIVGLGTGSTVYYTLERLAERVGNGLDIQGVPTSMQTALRARSLGIPLIGLDEADRVDLAIDGADQVDPKGYMIKGRGAAHTREKIVADAAERLVIVISPQKSTECLSAPVPVEVLPFAWAHVRRAVERFGGTVHLRESVQGRDGPVITDNGNLILDGDFGAIRNPPLLEDTLEGIPGVIGNGLFTRFTSKTRVFAGEATRVQEILFR